MDRKSSHHRKYRLLSVFASAITLAVYASRADAAYEHLPAEQDMSSEQREILGQDDARQYMLKLINRDRASVSAPPVVLDDLCTQAGQIHSDEMAINGYLSHWTMDGRKPDERYNDVGGKDAVAENAFGNVEGSATEGSTEPNKLPLHSAQVFHRYELDKIESSFFNEKPPYDGHRQNIINPVHTSAGIGLSFASNFGMGVRTACTQEFVNHYGDYGEIPKSLVLGKTFAMHGKLSKDVHLRSIDLRWEEMPKPMSISELNKTSSYGIPDKIITSYFAEASQTNEPIKVKTVDGQEEFSVDILTDKEWQPGLYYICLFADVGGITGEQLISTRTILLTSSE
jgi:uncharacterized protein YkwD